MRSIRRLRVSPATILSATALAVALGGTSYAAISLPSNSVGTAQLKNNAVTSTKVKNGSLLKADFKAGQLPAGPAGPAGAAGAAGPAGQNLTAETPLPSGKSESGFYTAASGVSGYIGDGISYTQPLQAPIADANVIWNKAGTSSTHCTGYGHADPGYLCLYDNEEANVTDTAFYSNGFSTPSAGIVAYWYLGAGGGWASGEWTVTAP